MKNDDQELIDNSSILTRSIEEAMNKTLIYSDAGIQKKQLRY